jgi:hypothetical protein
MEHAARFAFAALMLAHMAAYFAVRRFHGDDRDLEDGRICSPPRFMGVEDDVGPNASLAVGGRLPRP